MTKDERLLVLGGGKNLMQTRENFVKF